MPPQKASPPRREFVHALCPHGLSYRLGLGELRRRYYLTMAAERHPAFELVEGFIARTQRDIQETDQLEEAWSVVDAVEAGIRAESPDVQGLIVPGWIHWIALGRMAFGVLRTFMSRLKRDELVELKRELPSIMRQYEVHEGDYRQLKHNIEELERQPMIEVAAYREKFHPQEQAV